MRLAEGTGLRRTLSLIQFSNSHVISARFYDPGASPHLFFLPGKYPGERSAAGRFRQKRDPHRKPAGSEPIGAGGMRPGAVSGRHPRTRPAALHGADKLAPSALLLRRFLSPDRFR